jgi:hypothetical protein
MYYGKQFRQIACMVRKGCDAEIGNILNKGESQNPDISCENYI